MGTAKHPLDACEYYINRELSWLRFNHRVLSEAANPDNPLFERMKFLSIFSTNLDEFFMIRVASLRDQVQAGYKKPDPAGLKPKEQLQKVALSTRLMVQEQYRIYEEKILPDLEKAGIAFPAWEELTSEQRAYLEEYYQKEVFPVLTPVAVDGSHTFPLILNKSLNLGVLLESRSGKKAEFATVQVPSVLPRVVLLPAEENTAACVLMEDVIARFIDTLFAGRHALVCHPFRITRNADLAYDEEEASDLLAQIEKSLKKRKWGAVIRLEIRPEMDERLLAILQDALDVNETEIYRVPGPIHLDYFMKQLYALPGHEEDKYPAFEGSAPQALREGCLFEAIRQRDRLLHHPYDSFDPLIRFVQQAADDPNVLAIKQTLYRVSGHSPIVAALGQAAKNGKQVTVLLEVKARFDEENNIHWGKHLEKAGCHVIYGLPGVKTHSKILLVVRREADGIRHYVHLGTGNYNDETARLYSDMGILTADRDIGEDAVRFFNLVAGYTETMPMRLLIYAPRLLRETLVGLIQREREHALQGHPARIDAKMNSLADPYIIQALYEASCAGVTIDLTVRGICCLRPGIPDVSENILVRSIVGRFLEHTRIYRFENGGEPELYLSSADWMPRNLDRRVELLFPVRDEDIISQVEEVLTLQKEDTAKAWLMQPDGSYTRICPPGGQERVNAQEKLMQRAQEPLPHFSHT